MSRRRPSLLLTAGCAAAIATASFVAAAPAASAAGVPTITGVAPNAGSTGGGTSVTVTGTNFSSVHGVKFGATAGTSVHVVSSTKLTVTTPRHAAGAVDVRVTTAAGTSATGSADKFTFGAPPTVSHLSPTTGSAPGGDTITVTGTGLTGATAVTFGSAKGTGVHVNSSTSLTVVTPAHVPGTADVRVKTKFGTSATNSADRFTFTNPLPLTWTQSSIMVSHGGNTNAISCASSTLCVVVDDFGAAYVYNGSSWADPVRANADGGLASISCVTTGATTGCVTVGRAGAYAAWTGGSWTPGTVSDAGDLTHVSCMTATSCLAIDGSANGPVWQYAGGTGSWAGLTKLDHPLTALSCTPSVCVVGDSVGDVFTYNGSTWSAANPVDSGHSIVSLSCVGSNFCQASDADGRTFGETSGTWSTPVTYVTLYALTCGSTTFCAAANGADFFKWNGSWVDQGSSIGDPFVNSLSCVGTWCASLDFGNAVRTDVFGGSPGYASFPDTDYPTGVSCPTTTFCELGTAQGATARWTGSAWTAPAAAAGGVNLPSCTSATFCIGAGDRTLSRFDGSSWTDEPVPTVPGAQAISCASTVFCGLSTSGGVELLGSHGWSYPAVLTVNNGGPISCAAPRTCVAVDPAGRATVFTGRQWTNAEYLDDGSPLLAVSCTSATFCLVGDGAGNVITWNGSSWSAPMSVSSQAIAYLSCRPSGFCYAVDDGNNVIAILGTWHSASPLPAGIKPYALSCGGPHFCALSDIRGYAYTSG